MKYGLVMLLFTSLSARAQLSFKQAMQNMPVTKLHHGVTLTFDEPKTINLKPTKIILYALPNGNTTAQTFGKKLGKSDDWHFDIQHIGAQTRFVRDVDTITNYIVVYLENNLKSWPQWRRQTKGSDSIILQMVNDVYRKYAQLSPQLMLSGHSGGGSFIFGYINAQPQLPNYLTRLGFLDATYGYETEKHQQKLTTWLVKKENAIQVIAYNDSVVVYSGKPLVSATGGTWYRSKLMARDLGNFKFNETKDFLSWRGKRNSSSFILIKNPEAKIFHTVLVERNGFIHFLLNGTKFLNKNYKFWNKRAYESYILE